MNNLVLDLDGSRLQKCSRNVSTLRACDPRKIQMASLGEYLHTRGGWYGHEGQSCIRVRDEKLEATTCSVEF